MENELSHTIIGAAIEVHRTLGGPGLLESIYEEALCYELNLHGLQVQRQVPVQVLYKGVAKKTKGPSRCKDVKTLKNLSASLGLCGFALNFFTETCTYAE